MHCVTRRISGLTLSLLLSGVASTAGSVPGHIAADQVSLNSYVDFLDNYLYTHAGDNRGPRGAQHDLARDNIAALFESYGLTISISPFFCDFYGYYDNVIATQLGTVHPEQIYIISGHYDSVSNPGADDDASGVALVLEAARILSQYDSDATIIYIAFDMEEKGLVGSTDYVSQAYLAGANIQAMISADMVAYDTGSNYANVYGRTASDPLKSAVASAVLEYGIDLDVVIGGDHPNSDHASFEARGYQACVFDEGELSSNPFYHTDDDNFDNPNNLNFVFAHKMVRSVVGYLVDAAGVNVPSETLTFLHLDELPALVSQAGTTTTRVMVQPEGDATPTPATGIFHYDVGSGWQAVPMKSLATDEYVATFPAAPCGTELKYYFSADTVNGLTVTDPVNALSQPYTAIVAEGQVPVLLDDFEIDTGWTAGGTATTGLWERAVPVGCAGEPSTDYDGSGECYVTGASTPDACESGVDRYDSVLTSPLLDMHTGGRISYAYWVNGEHDRYHGLRPEDALIVEVAVDELSEEWIPVRTYRGPRSAWWTDEILVGRDVAASSALRLRFVATKVPYGRASLEAAIDAFTVYRWRCVSAPIGDVNCDGVVDTSDVNPFVVALTGQQAYETRYPDCDHSLADINGDGSVDFFDIDPFVVLLSTP